MMRKFEVFDTSDVLPDEEKVVFFITVGLYNSPIILIMALSVFALFYFTGSWSGVTGTIMEILRQEKQFKP